MSNSSNLNSVRPVDYAPTAAESEKAQNKSLDKTKPSPLGTVANSRNELNAQIVQSSLNVSLNTKNDPLSLVYKAAIENLNDILKPELGDKAIENAANDEFTPEAVAGRILAFVGSIFEMYRSQKRDDGASEENNATVDRFLNVVGSGIDKGFKEARNILDSLKVLNGDIAGNIDKTYDLIQKGLADFATLMKTPPPESKDPKDTKAPSVSDTVKPADK